MNIIFHYYKLSTTQDNFHKFYCQIKNIQVNKFNKY